MVGGELEESGVTLAERGEKLLCKAEDSDGFKTHALEVMPVSNDV